MELSRMLRQKGSTPHRDAVARALELETAERPDRSYSAILRTLNRDHRDDSGTKAAGADVEIDDGSDEEEEESSAEAGREMRGRRAAGGDDGDGAREAADTGEGSGGEGEARNIGKKKKAPSPKKKLPVKLTIAATHTLSGGLNPGADAFGLMDPSFKLIGVSHVNDGQAITVTATLSCTYKWGVHSLGNTDVPSGSAGFITAANYKAVADDIDPDKGESKNSARYNQYWSQQATELHELEHFRDDWEDFVPVKGLKVAKSVFKGRKVKVGDAETKISAMATKAAAKVHKASDKHYGASKSYFSRPGEKKAHAVGAAHERPLAAAVRAHGQSLERAAAAETAAAEAASEATQGAETTTTPAAESEAAETRGRRNAGFDRTVSRLMSMFD